MNEPKPKRRRRWYQFSLRSLMLFMVVCAVGFDWLGKRLDETRREQAVVAKIQKVGGFVVYHEMKGPDWLTRHFRKVQTVNLADTRVTDAEMGHLAELTGLEALDLQLTRVTDAGLVHLRGLISLDELYLFRTHVTDAGLVHLKALTNLEKLTVHDTPVTPEGVERLQQALPNCEIDR